MNLSLRSPLVPPQHACRSRRRPAAPWLLCAVLLAGTAGPLSQVQAQSPPPAARDAVEDVRDPRLSDSDRVFMRGVAPLVIRSRQLGELGRKKLGSGPGRDLASALSTESNQLFDSLKRMSDDLRTTIPMDMSEVSHQRLQALAKSKGQAFGREHQALAVQWIEEDIKALEHAMDKSE
ncbi:MAG: DUF4142 domain-containing protein, partial [Comamonadaceae bacterium]